MATNPTHVPEHATTEASSETKLTPEQQSALRDEAKQEEYRAAHLVQLRHLQCPGCGETDLF